MGRQLAWIFAAALGCDNAERSVEPTAAPAREPSVTARALDRTAAAMLSHVPADSPYVLVTAEPLPRGYVKRIEPLVDATLAAWERALAGPIPTRDPEWVALVSSLRGHMSAQGLRELGFATNPRWVFYGFGLAPVLRVELEDGRKVAELIAHVDNADGRSRERVGLGHRLWSVSSQPDDVGFTVAVVGNELVMSAYPQAIENQMLSHVLGREVPSRSLTDSEWMRTAARDHGLVPNFAGMIDFSRLAAILDGTGDPLSAQVVAAWDLELDRGPCTAAWRSLLDQAPRLWFGLRELDARGIGSAWIWELGPGLRKALSPVAAPIAGLSRSARRDGLAAVGVGIDAMAGFAVLQRLVARDRLGACFEEGDLDLEGVPTSTWMIGLRGGSAVLHEWDFRRNELRGVVVAGLDDPLEWLGTVAPSAKVGPLKRRRPALLEAVLAGVRLPGGEKAWIARGPHALGIANGDKAHRVLLRAVSTERDDGRSWASWSVDLHAVIESIPRAELDRALAEMGPAERPWVEAALDVVDRWDGHLALTAHGLEISGTLAFRRR